MEWADVAVQLQRYLLLTCYPVGVKILGSVDEVPGRARLPRTDMGLRIAICQAVSLARRYGWTVAVGREDHNCALGSVIFGFEPAVRFYEEGHLAAGLYTQSPEAGARAEAALSRLAHDPARCVVMAPLERISFIPDVVLVYGTPAQVVRLVQAALYHEGGALQSSFTGRGACAQEIVEPLVRGRSSLALPCNGERVNAQTQDHEMAFGIPVGELPRIMDGLAATHRHGVRYPIRSYLRYEGLFPASYHRLAEQWVHLDQTRQ